MRGKAKRYLRFLLPTGITPAYAGKSRCSRLRCGVFRDHPRVCGEKKKMNMRKDKRMGSPPRMRGKADYTPVVDVRVRITPACAGKRHCPRFRPGKTRDHPRVCGEKSSLMQMDVGPLGSPPRMRGKGCYMQELSGETGITPAYAGKSAGRSAGGRRCRDHPRVCGEKPAVAVLFSKTMGSPLRMRGKAPCG